MSDDRWSAVMHMALPAGGPWLTALQKGSDTKVAIGNYPDWEDWRFEVITDWKKAAKNKNDRRALVRPGRIECIPPLGLRRNAAQPSPGERDWIRHLAVVWHHGGFDPIMVLVAMTLHYRPRSRDKTARRQAITALYPLARSLGLDPRKPIAALYGVDSRTVDAWKIDARKAGVMPAYDPQHDVPAIVMPEIRDRTGEHAGRHLELRVTRPRVTDDGKQRLGPDLHVEGRWLDGTAFPKTKSQVPLADTLWYLLQLCRKLENVDYPGATVKVTVSNDR